MLPAALDSSLSTGAMPKGSSSCTAAGAAKKSTLRQGLAVPLLTKTLKTALTMGPNCRHSLSSLTVTLRHLLTVEKLLMSPRS